MKFLMITTLLILVFAVYQANTQTIVIEAEDFDAKQGESWQILTPPATVMVNDADPTRAPELLADDGTIITEFVITEASGDFIGNPDRSGTNGDWVKYVFDIPAGGDWYIWAKVNAPTIGDNSWYIGIDIADGDAVSEDNDNMNIWDFYETDLIPEGGDAPIREGLTTEWVWFRLCSRTGNPFPGLEVDQFGPNPTPLPLTAGEHTFHFAWREHSFCDMIVGTMDVNDDPNVDESFFAGEDTAVSPMDKLTSTWAQIKQTQ
jgi:hypothetical protein